MRSPEKIRIQSGVRWQVRFENAHRKICYRRFRTRVLAEVFVREAADARLSGVDPGRRVRFNELASEWTESHLAHGLRPSTVKDYTQALKRLNQAFGQRELRGIGPADLERARNHLVVTVQSERMERFERLLTMAKSQGDEIAKKLVEREGEIRDAIARGGNRAAAKMVACARTLWKFAIARGYAMRNIGADVKKPKTQRAVESETIDANILTPAEIERLIIATPPVHQCAVRFLFMTGVRLGELTGLMWTDIDWASSRVIVRRQRSAMTGELTAPKTKAGTRWIDLPCDLITELKRHRLTTPGDFMFPVDERNWRSRVWHPALRRAGLRSIRIHDARHTHASLLIGSGADVVAVSRRLGHANPSITLTTYSHAFQRRDAAPLGEQLAAFMRREASVLSR